MSEEEKTPTEEITAPAAPVKKATRARAPKDPNAPKRITNAEVQEKYGLMVEKLIDTIEKLDQIGMTTDVINQKIDELTIRMEEQAETVEPEKPAPAAVPAPAPVTEPTVGKTGSTGFREGPSPAPQPAAVPASQPAPQAQPVQEMGDYVTTKDVFNNYNKLLTRRDGELANSKFKNLMEKICLLREDYAKLCDDIERHVELYSGKEVLNSFVAYLVDMENMLTDAGITVGPYGSDGDPVDIKHQRIIGVINTEDPAKNGTVAQRVTDGYEYDGRAILKEKVNVYKLVEPAPAKTETGFREAP